MHPNENIFIIYIVVQVLEIFSSLMLTCMDQRVQFKSRKIVFLWNVATASIMTVHVFLFVCLFVLLFFNRTVVKEVKGILCYYCFPRFPQRHLQVFGDSHFFFKQHKSKTAQVSCGAHIRNGDQAPLAKSCSEKEHLKSITRPKRTRAIQKNLMV